MPATHLPSAEDVLNGADFDINLLSLRNPDFFVSGQIHENLVNWQAILGENDQSDEILKWLTNGVDVMEFFKHFKGNFKGRAYVSGAPPKQYFPNSFSCAEHVDFICSELCERIATGSIKLLGKVGTCKPPRIIMPLIVEPTKPRLCHDERFLNLWIKEIPFQLETLKDIPRNVGKNALMVTCDEKLGYDHVKLSENSHTYFGIQFGGYFMTYKTLPFGWKASPFIYQSIGMSVTSYLRSLGMLNTLYIDDRFAVTKGSNSNDHDLALRSLEIEGYRLSYSLLELLPRLGYTLSLKKCSLVPSSCKKLLGFLVDSVKQTFVLPDDKKLKFAELRESMLARDELDLKTLQRFCGKCISMGLAVPGCKLFCSEINVAISRAMRNSRSVELSQDLSEELKHWRFLDDWSGCSKWRPEFHKCIELSTDASGYKYGAVVEYGKEKLELSDYWTKGDFRPIHVKEADATLKSSLSLGDTLLDSWVDLNTDNLAVSGSWNGQKS